MSKESRTWGVILNVFIHFTEDNTSWILCKEPPVQLICGDTIIICKGPEQSQGYYKLGGENSLSFKHLVAIKQYTSYQSAKNP